MSWRQFGGFRTCHRNSRNSKDAAVRAKASHAALASWLSPNQWGERIQAEAAKQGNRNACGGIRYTVPGFGPRWRALAARRDHHRFPWLRHLFADGGYVGDKLKAALRRLGKWSIEIIKRSDAAKGFELLPRRWVVERTLAWLNRNRRLAKDFEQTIASATAWLFIASVQLFIRRIAKPCNHSE